MESKLQNKPEILKKDQLWKFHACFGYALIILGLGFPVWFATTKVDRASLPFDEISALSEPNLTESVLLISSDAFNDHQIGPKIHKALQVNLLPFQLMF